MFRRRRGPHLLRGHGVLRDEDDHLHDEPEPRAEHEQVGADEPDRGVPRRAASWRAWPAPRAPCRRSGTPGSGRSLVMRLPDAIEYDEADHHRQHEQAGHRGRGTRRHLQERRDEPDRGEHADAEHEADARREQEPRVLDARLDEHEQRGRDDESGEPGPRLGSVPAVVPAAAELGEEHEAGGRGGHEHDAEHVDPLLGLLRRQGQREPGDEERRDADRDVDVERQFQVRWSTKNPPSSGPPIADRPKIAPSGPRYLPRSEAGTMSAMIACDRIIRPPPPRPCIARKTTSCVKSPAKAPAGGSDREQGDRDEEQVAAPEDVAELAVDRHHDGRCEQVAGGEPRLVRDAAEFAHDGGHRRRHDRLVQARQEHAGDEGGEDDPDASLRQQQRSVGSGSGTLRALRGGAHAVCAVERRPGRLVEGVVEVGAGGDLEQARGCLGDQLGPSIVRVGPPEAMPHGLSDRGELDVRGRQELRDHQRLGVEHPTDRASSARSSPTTCICSIASATIDPSGSRSVGTSEPSAYAASSSDMAPCSMPSTASSFDAKWLKTSAVRRRPSRRAARW
ncbi:hypothetical protein Pfo_031581 [Paulownia fortunei]|nr:hypothetical protein Pfo_031581 [Paulownia fortunei]